ncbi:MAG TPA: SpoIIE family protein phosphatase [Anaerolineaceae bacterium]
MDNCQVLLENLVTASQAAILVNETWEIVYINPGAEKVFGYSELEVNGEPLTLLIPGALDDLLSETPAGPGKPVSGFLANCHICWVRGRRKSGDDFTALVFLTSQPEADRLVTTILLLDCAEPNHLDDRLKKLSVVVEQTPAMVMITDTRGAIEYVNPAFIKITGYCLDELIGANPRILKSGITPLEVYQEMWATISAGEVWYGEMCNCKKDGEFYWDLGTISPLRNEQGIITNYISVKEDITERKKNEEELKQYRQYLESMVAERTAELRDEINEHKRTEDVLREKERRLAEAQRIGRLGSWQWNIRTDELIWSEESYRIFGVDPGSFGLSYQNVLAMVHPDDRRMVENSLYTALSTGQPLNIDHKIILPDLQQRVISLNAVPVYDGTEEVSTLIGTIQDITERVRIEKELLEKERMTHELDIARKIQSSMLPKNCPTMDGWQLAAFYQPATQVGGDFYDFIALPRGQIGLVIGDVVDKGVPAALMMSLSRAIVRTIAYSGLGPADILLRSNEILYQDYSAQVYVTSFFGCLHPQSGQMELANAGHNRPLWFSAVRGDICEVASKGIVLGLYPKVSIEQKNLEVMPGDVLVLYTDGLTEATNAKGDFYGEDRVIESFRLATHKDAQEIMNTLLEGWRQFLGDVPQQDDISMIVVKRTA